jgi:hypothetical protein
MEDFERYGDYDDRDYDEPKKSGLIALILKWCIFAVCIGVVFIIVFRIVIFKNYPSSVTELYFTESLTEYYNEKSGEIGAKTQSLRAPYDNPKFSNFMCDYLIVVEEAGELQITVRYNDSMIPEAEAKYGLTGLKAGEENLLSFRLVDNNGNVCGTLAHAHYESRFMYNYAKLAFSGVDFGTGDSSVKWIRLEIFINEAKSDEPFSMIPIYENHEDFNLFSDYVLSDREKPEK